jgi:hypothetical protein
VGTGYATASGNSAFGFGTAATVYHKKGIPVTSALELLRRHSARRDSSSTELRGVFVDALQFAIGHTWIPLMARRNPAPIAPTLPAPLPQSRLPL